MVIGKRLEFYCKHSCIAMSCSSVVDSKHGLYAGGPDSIPTAVTTMIAVGGDAEHVSLNH